MASILIVEDSGYYSDMLSEVFEGLGHQTTVAYDGEEGLEAFMAGDFDISLVDYKMDRMDGMTFLKKLKGRDPEALVIMMTGDATVDLAVEAFKNGALDFLTKPIDFRDLRKTVEEALEVRKNQERARGKGKGTRSPISTHSATGTRTPFTTHSSGVTRTPFPTTQGGTAALPRLDSADRPPPEMALRQLLIGEGERMETLREQIVFNLDKHNPVILQGEPGTGKRVIGEFIHTYGINPDGPLVVVDAKALSEAKLTEMLVGEGGGGGSARRKARDGTLLLDHIHALTPDLQKAWSQILQEHRPAHRLIVTTEEDLDAMVDNGRFDDELLMQVAIVPALKIPPLREDIKDLELVLRHYMMETDNPYFESDEITFSNEAFALLRSYPWPRNYAEFIEIIGGVVSTTRQTVIGVDQLPYYLKPLSEWPTLEEVVAREKEGYVRHAMAVSGNDRETVAKMAGVTVQDLDNWLGSHP